MYIEGISLNKKENTLQNVLVHHEREREREERIARERERE